MISTETREIRLQNRRRLAGALHLGIMARAGQDREARSLDRRRDGLPQEIRRQERVVRRHHERGRAHLAQTVGEPAPGPRVEPLLNGRGRDAGRARGTSLYTRDPDRNLLEFIVY